MVKHPKSTLVFAGGPTAPAGVATALASALTGSPNSLIAAYYSGKPLIMYQSMLVVKNQVYLK